jgi:membrane-associated phospholipid phosphatase
MTTGAAGPNTAPPSKVESGQAPPAPSAGGLSLLAAAIGAALLSLLVASVARVYDAVQDNDSVARVDHPLLDWMVAHRSLGLDTVVTFFTNIGGPVILPILVTVVVVVLARVWRSWTPLALMVVAAAGSLAMTTAGKDLTARARPAQQLMVPPYETSPSFPSGHTLNSTLIAIVLAYLVFLHVRRTGPRTVAVVGLALYALAMGLSRVYLGQHWFTDVAAGWLLGAGWGVVVILAHRLLLLLQSRRHRQDREDLEDLDPRGGDDGPGRRDRDEPGATRVA